MATVSINRVVLAGYLTRDPERSTLPSGQPVCEMRLGVNTRRRNADGAYEDRPNFFDVVVYGPRAEAAAEHLSKGQPASVDGRLEWREWETKSKRIAQTVRVVADDVQFLGSRPRETHAADPDLQPGGRLIDFARNG